MRLLARVEDFFQLSHHSVILMRFLFEDGRIRAKEQIQLRTPDGKIRDTYVAAIVHMTYKPSAPRDPYLVGINLPPEITKEDVPPGSEIWAFRD